MRKSPSHPQFELVATDAPVVLSRLASLVLCGAARNVGRLGCRRIGFVRRSSRQKPLSRGGRHRDMRCDRCRQPSVTLELEVMKEIARKNGQAPPVDDGLRVPPGGAGVFGSRGHLITHPAVGRRRHVRAQKQIS